MGAGGMAIRGSVLLLLGLMLCACAETPDGTIVMNEETIENFFERGALKAWEPPSDLNLVMDQPVASAAIPPVPAGEVRVCGVLDSNGPYETIAPAQAAFKGARQRGSTFRNSVFGMVGDAATGGNAWFYADINKETGQIVAARAYLYGFNGGVCDLRQKPAQGWGALRQGGFSLRIDGYCYFPSESGATAAYELLVEGMGDPLAAPPRQNMYVNYIVDNNGLFATIPANPRNYWEIYDYGTGKANVSP